MTDQSRPLIRALRGDEAQALLARNRVGRIAFAFHDRVVAALRVLLPNFLTDDDPTPHRDVVFGVHASEISGRCSVSTGEEAFALVTQ